MGDKVQRLRRARKIRSTFPNNIEERPARLSVHKTPRHTYGQIVCLKSGDVLASASTLSADMKKGLKHTGNIEAAEKVGQAVAELGLKKGLSKVAFDRSGFPYHGRVKAFAEAARKAGLNF